MTEQELQVALAFLNQQAIGLEVYFILKDDQALQVRFADIEEGMLQDIQTALLGYLGSRFLDAYEVNVQPLSEAEHREGDIYYYDLAEVPADLQCIDTAMTAGAEPEFSFATDDLRKLYGFIFLIGNEGNKIALYKKHYPINLMRQDRVMGLVRADHRFVRLATDVIKINETFDFLKIGEELFVFSLALLERLYGFDGILFREAGKRIAIIRDANLIENIEVLEELAKDKKWAKKLLRAKRSSQVLSLGFPAIRTFIQLHPKLRNRIHFNEAQDRIRFHTKASQMLFLKLLDDDFLKSDLTGVLYDSENKQGLTPDEEPDGTE